jgi:hypothetical protein
VYPVPSSEAAEAGATSGAYFDERYDQCGPLQPDDESLLGAQMSLRSSDDNGQWFGDQRATPAEEAAFWKEKATGRLETISRLQGQLAGSEVEYNNLRERFNAHANGEKLVEMYENAAKLWKRIAETESICSALMTAGLAECDKLRHERDLYQGVAMASIKAPVSYDDDTLDRWASILLRRHSKEAEDLVNLAMSTGLAECEELRALNRRVASRSNARYDSLCITEYDLEKTEDLVSLAMSTGLEECDMLRDSLGMLSYQYSRSCEELSNCESTISQLDAAGKAATENLVKVTEERNALQRQCDELSIGLSAATEELAELQGGHDRFVKEMRKGFDDLVAEKPIPPDYVDGLRATVRELTAEKDRLTKRERDLLETCGRHLGMMREARAKLAESEAMVKTLRREVCNRIRSAEWDANARGMATAIVRSEAEKAEVLRMEAEEAATIARAQATAALNEAELLRKENIELMTAKHGWHERYLAERAMLEKEREVSAQTAALLEKAMAENADTAERIAKAHEAFDMEIG